ncbi:MAG TPA: hypothetical protein VJX67_05940 [Blastocatellia bacterium]|nr:hypothetical protein [Blastocatellia bacterium]
MTIPGKPDFSGPFEKALTNLAATVDSIWEEHGTSFVKAGDDKVFALGGAGFVVVVDEKMWGGLVEILTPTATITARPGDDGKLSVASGDLDQAAINKLLKKTSEALRSYYEKRYWRTPKTA